MVFVVVVIETFDGAGLVGSFYSTHGGNADHVAKITMARPKRKQVEKGLLPARSHCGFVGPLLFVASTPLHIIMEFPTFTEWLARRDEGLLFPDRPPLKGMPRINAFPGTDAQRKKLHVKPAKKPTPFALTIRRVAEIVPHQLIPKLTPYQSAKPIQ